jgi:hypothetical protein
MKGIHTLSSGFVIPLATWPHSRREMRTNRTISTTPRPQMTIGGRLAGSVGEMLHDYLVYIVDMDDDEGNFEVFLLVECLSLFI